MDERTWSVVSSFQAFLDEAVGAARVQHDDGPPLRDAIEAHVGPGAASLPIVRLDVPGHQFVNLDVAMAALVEEHGGGAVLGIGGGDQRNHQTLGDMLQRRGPWSAAIGPVDRTRLDTGPASSREAVTMGVHLFRYAARPVAVLQRRSEPRFGQQSAVEVLAPADVSEQLLADVRRLMVERSVFRGQMLSFGLADEMYGQSTGGIAFLPRPDVTAAEVVLPPGTLARIERHVAGVALHRSALVAAGRHLKRGLLLYGPPRTGKTHTVRYLVGQLPGVTTVVLAGGALGLVAEATELAHALQPSLVVLEDVDLIAEHREAHFGPQPLLFTLLDAMDGLANDADVAFVLTTNRVDLLESALTQRPGRIDLAVPVPRPDRAARRALLDLCPAGGAHRGRDRCPRRRPAPDRRARGDARGRRGAHPHPARGRARRGVSSWGCRTARVRGGPGVVRPVGWRRAAGHRPGVARPPRRRGRPPRVAGAETPAGRGGVLAA